MLPLDDDVQCMTIKTGLNDAHLLLEYIHEKLDFGSVKKIAFHNLLKLYFGLMARLDRIHFNPPFNLATRS